MLSSLLAMLACSCPYLGGEVAEPPRAIHNAMLQTITTPVPDADVFKQN